MDGRLSCCMGVSAIQACNMDGILLCCVGGSPMVDCRVVWVDLPW